MGPFPPPKKCEYILVAVDYVSKWVEALPCKNADNINSKRMFEEIIFPRFEVPKIVISDGGSHFIDKHFEQYLSRHGIRHNVTTPYHPQTSCNTLDVCHSLSSGFELKHDRLTGDDDVKANLRR
jgi:hypothetical protein